MSISIIFNEKSGNSRVAPENRTPTRSQNSHGFLDHPTPFIIEM
jgi:hypothetical protein